MSSEPIIEQTNIFSTDIAKQLYIEKREVNLMLYLESVSLNFLLSNLCSLFCKDLPGEIYLFAKCVEEGGEGLVVSLQCVSLPSENHHGKKQLH